MNDSIDNIDDLPDGCVIPVADDTLPDRDHSDPAAHGEPGLNHAAYEERAFWDSAALAALQGLLAWSPHGNPRQYNPPDAAERACEYADALLAQRRARLKGRA